jgi:hypothetical protein
LIAALAALACAAFIAGASRAHARTIEFTDQDADHIAAIDAAAPRMGWAAYEVVGGFFVTTDVGLRPKSALLIRVPLDKIPAGMRITKAEWTVRSPWASIAEPQLYCWRLMAEWGIGACYQYRTTSPKPVEWATAGARAGGTDRADRPSVVVTCKANEDVTLNVTEDVELWYSGAAPNNGWMFTVEDDIVLRLVPPAYAGRGSWKLRVTYEPQ